MFQQLGAPVLGVVENMSYFPQPDGSIADIFGRGGALAAAQELGLPFLGEVPMFTALRVNSDTGDPEANFTGDPKLREALEHVVTSLAGEVSRKNLGAPGPALNIS
jgi:ATP-binding protein involved in chromosome partitioning